MNKGSDMSHLSSRVLLLCVSVLALALTAVQQAQAQSSDGLYRSTPLGLYPPNIGFGSSGPMVMLAASKDHTLFSPIYTDYEDIDGDGTDDFTFKPAYTYYGYFDSSKCYAYKADHKLIDKENRSERLGRFEPVAVAKPEIDPDSKKVFQSCLDSGGPWGGNFLNWATMTRIDVVRKTLYGGKRVDDTADDTTLEMAQMATDAHSFVKYYSGADLKHFTPFDQATDMGGEGLTICNRGSDYFGFKGAPIMRLAQGNYSLWATIRGEVCNWKGERAVNDEYKFGEKVRKFYDKYGPSRGAYLDTQNGDPKSHKVDLPVETELLGVPAELAVRVQVCKPELLGKERCKPHGSGDKVVYKPIGLLQEFAATEVDARPARAEFGLITGSYDSNLKGGFLRKNMGSINDELDRDTGRFCHRLSSTELTTVGSRCKTTSGIVRAFDEIRLYSAGDYNNALQPGADRTGVPNTEFLRPQDLRNGDHASWGNPMSEMIVQALAYFAGDAASQQTILGMSKAEADATKRDKEVGLPSDVPVLDPLDDSSKSIDPASGLLRSKLYGKGMCRPMHVLAISSGTVSFDTDETGSNDDIYDTVTPFFSRVKSTDTLASLTHQVGDNERISDTDRSVGSVNGGFGQDCEVKGIGKAVSDGLARVAGVCPEAPGIKGSYLGAGAALAANTRAIRPIDNGSVTVGGTTLARDKLPAHALRVKTYAASLAGGVARIEVPVGDTGKKVYITPESSWRHDGFADSDALMPGAMLTFRALDVGQDSTNPKRRFGSYIVTWNDAQFGGDYDEDLTGFIRWEIEPVAGDPTAYELRVLTDVFAMSAGAQGAHGFSIVGVDVPPATGGYKRPGRYLTHGANGFDSISECQDHATNNSDLHLRLCSFDNRGMRKGNATNYDGYAWPTTFKNSTVDFVEKGGTSTTVVSKFKVTQGTEGVTLRDPLWYIAKYGSFDTGEAPNTFKPSVDALPQKVTTPGTSANWDRQDNANPDCAGAACADGEPDGYFLARRPELLETRLRQLLGNIAATSNAAPAVSSTQLLVGKRKFQSEFARNEFSGTVKTFVLDKQGVFIPSWDAGKQLEDAGSANRRVITNVEKEGVLFTDAMFSGQGGPDYLKAMLGLSASETATDAQVDQAKVLVNYLRGSRDAEDAQLLKVRGTKNLGIMGPVVSSTPWVQDHEFAARFADGIFPSGVPSYRAFIGDKAKGESMVWVGSNDGMLHGMKVSDGAPVLSYVPSPLVARLSTALSAQNSEDVALMDGSPFTADVLVPSTGQAGVQAWRTYLFSSLGRGGRALFALDVTVDGKTEGGLKGKAPANVFRWVFTAQDDAWAPTGATPASDLGYNVQDPIKHPASDQPAPVVYLNDGNFWLLHPNGHGSDSGRAVLFLFKMTGPGEVPWRDPETGATNGYIKLATRAVEADENNGLMGVTWVDLDNNKTADLVYGTDLKGQLWRFDLRDKDPNNWRVGLYDPAVTGAALAKEGTPLFAAKDASGKPLPIMSAPAATLPSYGGVMLSFGTGLALESGDFPDVSRTQRFFTVWDRGGYVGDRTFAPPQVLDEATQNTVERPNPLPDLARLTTNQNNESVKTFIQRFAFRDDAGNVFLAKTTSEGTVETDQQGKPVPVGPVNSELRFDPAIHDGWFFEFPDGGAQGEAVLSSPGVRSNFVFFTSVRGQTTQEQELACSQQPSSTLYAVSPVNGLPVNSLLVNGAYYLGTPVNDQKLIIVRDRTGDAPVGDGVSGGGGGGGGNSQDPPGACTGGTVSVRVLGGAGGTSQRLCVPAASVRIQWRELPGLRTQ